MYSAHRTVTNDRSLSIEKCWIGCNAISRLSADVSVFHEKL
jgi:hypothetical protein